MISKNAEIIQSALSRVAKVSLYAKYIFLVIFIAYCVVAAVVFTSGVLAFWTMVDEPASALFALLQVGSTLMAAITPALVLYVIFRVFADIANGDTPFTLVQARRIQIVGLLLIAGVVFEVILPLAPIPYYAIGDLDVGLIAPSSTPSGLKIDLTSLLWSVVCLSFSYVFRYGSLLQQLSDETV